MAPKSSVIEKNTNPTTDVENNGQKCICRKMIKPCSSTEKNLRKFNWSVSACDLTKQHLQRNNERKVQRSATLGSVPAAVNSSPRTHRSKSGGYSRLLYYWKLLKKSLGSAGSKSFLISR